MDYTHKSKIENHAKALLVGVNASFKDLGAVCSNVKGMPVVVAVEFLKNASEGKQAIHFKKHFKKKGHQKMLGGKIGGFPKKSAKIVLKVLNSAVANAMKKSLSPEAMYIEYICANKVLTYSRMSPRGKRMRSDVETAKVEIIISESKKLLNLVEKTKTKKQDKTHKEEVKQEKLKEEDKPKEQEKSKEEIKQEDKTHKEDLKQEKLKEEDKPKEQEKLKEEIKQEDKTQKEEVKQEKPKQEDKIKEIKQEDKTKETKKQDKTQKEEVKQEKLKQEDKTKETKKQDKIQKEDVKQDKTQKEQEKQIKGVFENRLKLKKTNKKEEKVN